MVKNSCRAVASLAVGTSAAINSTTTASGTLSSLCTVSNVQAALPANGTLLGIDLLPNTVTVNTANSTTRGSSASYPYCNVTVAYTHTGKGDKVVLKYAFPEPSSYESRFYVAGGGGYSLSSDATGGLAYGAVGGCTDGGYDAFNYSYDEKFLYGNGSINWDSTYMFAYQGLGEMTKVGKVIAPGFYGAANSSGKVYTYFEGCSDGGREGMSQVQRYGDEYDGVVAGAPAFRFAQQQVLHVYPATVSHVQDYFPPTCALDKIVNATIETCDSLDGRTDGVIGRTDLCKLNFNLSSIVGQSYYCAEQNSSSLGFGFSKRNGLSGPAAAGRSVKLMHRATTGSTSSYTPEQNGTVTAEDVAVAQAVYDGVITSEGKRAYLSWQIGSDLSDADPTYNTETGKWEQNIPSTGGMYVAKYIKLQNVDNLSDLNNVTYDTLTEWMTIGMVKYMDSLQTTIPDLSTFKNSGGKLLHYHGESDPSIPAASSVHYWQSVRSIMYNNATDEEALTDLKTWYQFYLVPGAAHCGANSLQPGPYPQSNMDIIIDWVENGVQPSGLNTTVSSGEFAGEEQLLCQWPTRPVWQSNSSATFDCVNDTASVESWTYTFDAFKMPVY